MFNNTFAGLSGPAVRPIALRMVWQAVGAVSIPVVGLGGILTGKDALEFIMAGAAAVQVGTANFLDPKACTRITNEIGQWMDATASRRWMRSEGAHGKSPIAFPLIRPFTGYNGKPGLISRRAGRRQLPPRGKPSYHIRFACIFIQNMLL